VESYYLKSEEEILVGDAQVICKLPHSVEEALEIDRQMGTDHWQRALNKERAKAAKDSMECP
jgi:hypothetical protein